MTGRLGETMAETIHESARPSGTGTFADGGEGRKIRDRRHGTPSNRVDAEVTRDHLPLLALKWVAVGLGVLMMLVVAPLLDLVVSMWSGLRRLFWAR